MPLIIIVSIHCELAFYFSLSTVRKYLADTARVDKNNLISLFCYEPS